MARRPEVLAPAGDADAMRAAVRAGADAVYFGLQGFNARARATNFDAAGLEQTMRELHAHGVRGLRDAQHARLRRRARVARGRGARVRRGGRRRGHRAGPRRREARPRHRARPPHPRLDADDVHRRRRASSSRARSAPRASSSRASCRSTTSPPSARETDAELEVFVHGALCIAYSGQCLTSEAIGGRSANRGACAQACRLPYELVVDGVRARPGRPRVPPLARGPRGERARAGAREARRRRRSRSRAASRAPSTSPRRRRSTARAIDAHVGERGPRSAAAADVHARLGAGLPRRASTTSASSRGARATTAGSRSARCEGVRRARGKEWHRRARASDDVARGDGLLVEGGWGGEGEVGGRVWDGRGRRRDRARCARVARAGQAT